MTMKLSKNLFYFYFILIISSLTLGSTINCTCVPYYQCTDDTENLIVDGLDLLDIRKYNISKNENTCKGYFDVCCDASDALIQTSTEPEILFKGCGYMKLNEHPWFGTLYYQKDISKIPKYKCGASFIHKQAVLTAAHCLNNDGVWTIRKGEETIVNVKKVVFHSSYSSGTLRNDIAVVILDEPIEMDDIGLICIPPPNILLTDTPCMVNTFNSNNKNDHSNVKLVKIPLVDKQKCLRSLRKTRLGEFFQLHYSFICAGGDDYKDVCMGDGGSPLVCPIPGQPERYHQTGIVSWGIGCTENNIPGIYVNVAFFRDWIDEVMIKNGLDIHSYRY